MEKIIQLWLKIYGNDLNLVKGLFNRFVVVDFYLCIPTGLPARCYYVSRPSAFASGFRNPPEL
jgi:hypothetical protein